MISALSGVVRRVHARLTRMRLVLGMILAAILAAGFTAMNVSSGPLYNLNDIGGWGNRLVFLILSGGVLLGVLAGAVLMHRGSFGTLALRQGILYFGFMLLMMGINQKSYAYQDVLQPVVRAMDSGSLADGFALTQHLSAPALTLLYAVTRGPVYDMYMVKLLCAAGYMLLALCALRAADRANMGVRAQVLLTMIMILPQGFMAVGCVGQTEVLASGLLALSLLMATEEKPRSLSGMLLYALACALSGAALYALPAYLYLAAKGKIRRAYWLAMLLPAALCLPAMMAGVPVWQALGSLLRANFAVPQYAAGVPNVMSLIPPADPMQTQAYAILSRMPELDMETYAQPYYTQAHYETIMRGFSLAAPAVYAGVCALMLRRGKADLRAAMTLLLAGLYLCPAATTGAWILLDAVCVYALLAKPELRVPAFIVLFTTMASGCYPLARDVLLPMFACSVLCLTALCMLLGVVPMTLKRQEG